MGSAVRRRITDFASVERERFDERTYFVRIGALTQVGSLLEFLAISVEDYALARDAFLADVEERRDEMRRHGPGVRRLTDEEVARMDERRRRITVLHFRIETFYVFGKILLDKVAQAIEHYFGQARNTSLARHSRVRRNLEEFARQKGLLAPPARFLEMLDELDRRVVEYRDRYVTHEDSPRTMKATSFIPGEPGVAMISVGRIYPSESELEANVQSESPIRS
jgi:hypothetical protein